MKDKFFRGCLLALSYVLSDISASLKNKHPVYGYLLKGISLGILEINQTALPLLGRDPEANRRDTEAVDRPGPEANRRDTEAIHRPDPKAYRRDQEVIHRPDPKAYRLVPLYKAGPEVEENYHRARQIQQELNNFDLASCPTPAGPGGIPCRHVGFPPYDHCLYHINRHQRMELSLPSRYPRTQK
ncbi:hypothetical protein GGS21DRAFT_526049 [Xylaria nigripes]|nr:hypothetical protein GGS21DRAFT_526049 [Xylaria nigripes]